VRPRGITSSTCSTASSIRTGPSRCPAACRRRSGAGGDCRRNASSAEPHRRPRYGFETSGRFSRTATPDSPRPPEQCQADQGDDPSDHGPLPVTAHPRSVQHVRPLGDPHSPDETQDDACNSSPHGYPDSSAVPTACPFGSRRDQDSEGPPRGGPSASWAPEGGFESGAPRWTVDSPVRQSEPRSVVSSATPPASRRMSAAPSSWAQGIDAGAAHVPPLLDCCVGQTAKAAFSCLGASSSTSRAVRRACQKPSATSTPVTPAPMNEAIMPQNMRRPITEKA